MGDNPTPKTPVDSIGRSTPVAYGDAVIDELLAPWRTATTWRRLSSVALAPVLGTVSFTVVIVLLSVTTGLLITFPLALPFAWLLFVSARAFSHLQRSRLASMLDVELADPVPDLPEGNWWRHLVERAKSGPRWREIGHALLALPVSVLGFVVASVTWAGSIALLTLPLWVNALPGDTAKFWLFEVGQGPAAVACALVGLVGLVVIAPRATDAMVHLDVAAARWLIGPSEKAALAAQVGRVETRRVAAVDAAEAERRRIERDLHDGAQQRLVALAMDLGAARERMDLSLIHI